jgi:hypothetical protein
MVLNCYFSITQLKIKLHFIDRRLVTLLSEVADPLPCPGYLKNKKKNKGSKELENYIMIYSGVPSEEWESAT